MLKPPSVPAEENPTPINCLTIVFRQLFSVPIFGRNFASGDPNGTLPHSRISSDQAHTETSVGPNRTVPHSHQLPVRCLPAALLRSYLRKKHTPAPPATTMAEQRPVLTISVRSLGIQGKSRESPNTTLVCAMSSSVASSADEHEDNVKNNNNDKSAENSNAQVVTTSLTLTTETTTLQEAIGSEVARVTPQKNKEDAKAAKRKSRFELHKEIKKSNPVPMNMTRRIHNALRSTTKFLYEATADMRYAEKKRVVMNVLYPFHTECNGVVIVLVKENNPNQGGFLGGLLTSELVPVSHNINIPREKKNTIAEKVGIHFLMKLRSESEIEREHKVQAIITDQARARALKQNREPYSGHHTTPVFVHYPATLKAADFMQQEGSLEKFAEVLASKIEVALTPKDDKRTGKSTEYSLVNMYKVAPLFDFRTSDDEDRNSKILLGHILTPNDILKIVGPVLDIFSWDAFLENSDAMEMYFGTGDLRKEVEQLKGGKFARSFNPGDTESMADKQAKLAAEKKKKKADEEDDFLAKFGS